MVADRCCCGLQAVFRRSLSTNPGKDEPASPLSVAVSMLTGLDSSLLFPPSQYVTMSPLPCQRDETVTGGLPVLPVCGGWRCLTLTCSVPRHCSANPPTACSSSKVLQLHWIFKAANITTLVFLALQTVAMVTELKTNGSVFTVGRTQARGLHPGRRVDRVTKQAVTRHLGPHDARNHRACSSNRHHSTGGWGCVCGWVGVYQSGCQPGSAAVCWADVGF